MAEEVAEPSPQQPIETSSVQALPPVESPVIQLQQDSLATKKQSDDSPLKQSPVELQIGHDADGSKFRAGDSEAASEEQDFQPPSTQLAPEKVETPIQLDASKAEIVAAPEVVASSAVSFLRGEIDTAAPFESVKEAVSMFGARMDWKPPSRTASMETGNTSETDVHNVQEDLAFYKEQIALTRTSTANVILELEKTKDQIQTLTTGSDDCQNKEQKVLPTEILNPSEQPKEKHLEWERQKYEIVISESQMVRRETESVKEELLALKDSKEVAMRESQEATTALDLIIKRVEGLSTEHISINEALVAAQAALIEAEEQLHLLRSDNEAESSLHQVDKSKLSSENFLRKPADIEELKSKLEETNGLVDKLKEELNSLKEAEEKATLSASEAQDAAEKCKLELEEAKSAEMRSVAGLGGVAEELDQVTLNVSKAREEGASLASAVQVLKSEVDSRHMELESMHEKEQTACAALASLQDELCKVRELLMSAQAGEKKAKEAKENLPTAIKKAAAEADEAKAAAEASKEEIRKARHETEQAKAATSTAIRQLQAALKESEACRVSESMAVAEFNALTESETKVTDLESEAEKGTGVTISLEEYSSLKQAAQEAEDVANKKVTAALAQVEAAKASQREAQSKLDLSVKEAEKSGEDLLEAQRKADEAQEAKLAAEGELRKWRAEHEHRRKSVSTPLPMKMTADQSPQVKVSNGEGTVKSVLEEKVVPFQERKKGLDSLAQVLSLKVPPPEQPGKFLAVENIIMENEKLKKKTFFTRIASFIAGKKVKTVNR